MSAVPEAVLGRAVADVLEERRENARHLADTLHGNDDKTERDTSKQITSDILRFFAETLAEWAEDLCVDSIAVSETVREAAGEDDVDCEATGQSVLFPSAVTNIET